MRLIELFNNLLEYDHQITLTKQGPQLKAAYDKNEFDSALAGGEVESSEILTRLEQMDPTVNKMYMLWIVRQYMNSKMRLEDYPQVFGGLEAFHKAKPRLPVEQRDINRFDLHQLYELVDSFSDTQQEPSNDTKLNRDDVDVIYNGPLGTIASPKTEEASCELGSGTQWCTAGKQNNAFKAYNSPEGNLIIFQAPGGAKYQFMKNSFLTAKPTFMDGFNRRPEWVDSYEDDDGDPYGDWFWPPKLNLEVADSHDRYLGDKEIKELYEKNPVLQKYLPITSEKSIPDAKVHKEEFEQFIKAVWIDPLEAPYAYHVDNLIKRYEEHIGPLKLERDLAVEKALLDVHRTDIDLRPNIEKDYVYHLFNEAGLKKYIKATGMKRWPELEKIILNTFKLWHSKDPEELSMAYSLGFSGTSHYATAIDPEFLAIMPSVTKYLKSIGLSKAA